jgi:hypothetical protein
MALSTYVCTMVISHLSFSFSVLGIKHRAWHMLSKRSIIQLHLKPNMWFLPFLKNIFSYFILEKHKGLQLVPIGRVSYVRVTSSTDFQKPL